MTGWHASTKRDSICCYLAPLACPLAPQEDSKTCRCFQVPRLEALCIDFARKYHSCSSLLVNCITWFRCHWEGAANCRSYWELPAISSSEVEISVIRLHFLRRLYGFHFLKVFSTTSYCCLLCQNKDLKSKLKLGMLTEIRLRTRVVVIREHWVISAHIGLYDYRISVTVLVIMLFILFRVVGQWVAR